MRNIVELILLQEIVASEKKAHELIKLGQVKFNGREITKEGPVILQPGIKNIISVGKNNYEVKTLRSYSMDEMMKLAEGV